MLAEKLRTLVNLSISLHQPPSPPRSTISAAEKTSTDLDTCSVHIKLKMSNLRPGRGAGTGFGGRAGIAHHIGVFLVVISNLRGVDTRHGSCQLLAVIAKSHEASGSFHDICEVLGKIYELSHRNQPPYPVYSWSFFRVEKAGSGKSKLFGVHLQQMSVISDENPSRLPSSNHTPWLTPWLHNLT